MKRSFFIYVLAVLAVLLFSCSSEQKFTDEYDYPHAPRQEIYDEYHGVSVADPYRWLEYPDDAETMEWVRAENALTRSFLDVPMRDEIKAEFTELWNYERYSAPSHYGGRFFYWKNDGLQNQDVLYMRRSLDGQPEVILNPNKMSADGTVSVSEKAYSHDGKFLVYAISEKGSDWEKLKIRDIDKKEDFEETLHYSKFSDIGWLYNNSGFFYNRYPDTNLVAYEDRHLNNKIYLHKLGTDQSKDELIFEMPDEPNLGLSPKVTEDGKYLIINIWKGTDPENRIYYREIGRDGEFVRLLDQAEAEYVFLGNRDDHFYFKTHLNAPNSRIIAIDLRNPERENWIEVVPEDSDVLACAYLADERIIATYLHHAYSIMKIYSMEGEYIRDISLPTIGSVHDIKAKQDQSNVFFKFSSFLYPAMVFRYNPEENELTEFAAAGIEINADEYETYQKFATSKDGTRVPIFITHRKGLELSGKNPTLLYGYGGFNVNRTPGFSTSKFFWIKNGGVYVSSVLRGGTEYGEEWHRQGILENKQNVFDDFIAAAEWLIDSGYTDTDNLVIEGGSNGGLLVAACMIQRPDLYGAVLCKVPVIDMLRYHKFTVGMYWTGEYGNAELYREHFDFLMAYSPLHNIKEGETYPATLITTADTDDRVVPMHGKKFAAALQYADSGKNPILLRVETKAGHGAGKPTTKLIDYYTDIYTFLFKVLEMDPYSDGD